VPQVTPETQLASEDRLWEGLSLPTLGEEELATQQAETGDRVHLNRGVWWNEIKPFFSMPCDIFSRRDRRESWPRRTHALAGYMHLSVPNSPTNSIYRAIVRIDVDRYSIRNLSRNRRRNVSQGLSDLEVRPIELLEDLIVDGYEVYVSWHRRVQWGTDKTDRARFEAWMSRVFRQSNQIILGAYRDNKLVAFMLPRVVGTSACPCFVASHADFLDSNPNDALFHAFLCIARQTKGVQTANLGPLCNKSSLNQFKLHYGNVKSFPSYLWINPMIRPVVFPWIRRRYPWLGLPSAA
jgi:hypothetical protein